MGFSKINWNTGELIAIIKVQEANGMKMGEWTIKIGELDKFNRMIKEKFGSRRRDRDLDWMR